MAIIRRNISTVYGLAARLDGIDSEVLKRGKFLGRLTTVEATDTFANASGFVPGSVFVASDAGAITLVPAVPASEGVDPVDAVELSVHENDTVIITGSEVTTANDVVVISESLREKVSKIGDTTTLTTEAKDTLTAAVNELKTGLDTVTDIAVDADYVDGKIAAAKIALGTNFTVANMTERDALTDLETDDRVYVRDTGEGKWATYKPVTFDETTGAVTDWLLLMSQDIVENALNAEGVKAAYESNADTNAFDDAAKAKSDLISVTGAVDLDDVVTVASLVQDITAMEAGTKADSVASIEAMTAWVNQRINTSSATPFTEKVTVSGDNITLTHTPRGGVSGIMNFSTVRWVDANGVSWDAPVIATADPKVFEVVADADLEWDTNEVQIQYLYQPNGG